MKKISVLLSVCVLVGILLTACEKTPVLKRYLPQYKVENRGGKFGVWASRNSFKTRFLSAQFEYDKVDIQLGHFPIMEKNKKKYILIDREILGPFQEILISLVKSTSLSSHYSDFRGEVVTKTEASLWESQIFAKINDSSSLLIAPFMATCYSSAYGDNFSHPVVFTIQVPYGHIEPFNNSLYFLAKDKQGKSSVLFGNYDEDYNKNGKVIQIIPFQYYQSIDVQEHNKKKYLICLSKYKDERFWLRLPEKVCVYDNRIIPLKTDFKIVSWLKNGNSVIQNKDNKIGLIDWNGQILAPTAYERFKEFDNGNCLLINPGRLKIKNPDGY